VITDREVGLHLRNTNILCLKIILAKVIALPTKITRAQPAKREKNFIPQKIVQHPYPSPPSKKKMIPP